MAEFTAPVLTNNFTSTRLLANITDSSVMLQIYPNGTSEYTGKDSVVQFDKDSVKFYNDILVPDKTSGLYNQEVIQNYIDSGILSDVEVLPIGPKAAFAGVANSSHVINNELKKTLGSSNEDHLEVVYSTDINNKLKVLAYRDIDGISYSLDGGISSIKTPSFGLLYPSEITSLAIQNYAYPSATGTTKLWIGTLREGLKSYTLGAATWVSETNLEKTAEGIDGVSGKFLFRRTTKNPIWDDYVAHPENYEDSGTVYRYIAGDYEPTYVLGIVNNPISAGIPLVVYVKSFTYDGYSTAAEYRYLSKYLSPDTLEYSLDSTYSTYRVNPGTVSTDWTILPVMLPEEIEDVLKTIPTHFPSSITDTGSITTAVAVFNNTAKKFTCELLTITTGPAVNGNSILFTHSRDAAFAALNIEANKFSGFSRYDTTLFVTERTKIWRKYNSTWEAWLIADDTKDEKNTRVSPDFKFTVVGSTSYISGFRGFGVLKSTTANSYIGILNTDLGHLVFSLASVTSDFMKPITGSKKLRKDLFSTSVRDFQVIYETNSAISCGLVNELVTSYKLSTKEFSAPVRTMIVTGITSTNLFETLSNKIEPLFYKNYIYGSTGTAVLHNRYNIWDITEFNTDQLYLTTTISDSVLMLKTASNNLNYNDARSFSWLDTLTSPVQDAAISVSLHIDYLTACAKYNRPKLLLRAVEYLTLSDYTLETRVEQPIVLDFEYQLLSAVSGYVNLNYVVPGYVP